jgi:hypothetical protein
MSSSSLPGRFAWVVLREHIPIFDADEKDPEDLVMAKAIKDWAAIKDGSSILEQFSLDAHLLEPPELSTLYLRAKLEVLQRGIDCMIESVVENFVVMTLQVDTGAYGLVYDAAKNSLSLFPTAVEAFADQYFARKDLSMPFQFLRQPAILQRDDGSYDLLNLGLCFDDICRGFRVLQPSAILFRWSSAVKKWTKQDARFNPQTLLPPGHPKRMMYEVDVVFTFEGKVFWVDLLLGAIVCDVLSTTDACDKDSVELDFIHLPEECKGQALEDSYRHTFEDSYPKHRRTMGRVGSSIKLISVVTTDGDTPNDHTLPKDVVLQSWTLGPDLRSWTRDDDMELPLPLLWQSESYKRESLPEAVPLNPVLKADEDGVLYLLLGDYYVDWRRHARLCREMECVISIDMRRKSLLSRSRRPITEGLLPPLEAQPSKRFSPDMPSLFGVRFCAQHTEWSDGLGQKGNWNHRK